MDPLERDHHNEDTARAGVRRGVARTMARLVRAVVAERRLEEHRRRGRLRRNLGHRLA